MTTPEHGLSESAAPGLEPGGGVPPGETPPAEGSTHAALTDARPVSERSPDPANRTPMVVTLVALAVLVGVAVVAVFVALAAGR